MNRDYGGNGNKPFCFAFDRNDIDIGWTCTKTYMEDFTGVCRYTGYAYGSPDEVRKQLRVEKTRSRLYPFLQGKDKAGKIKRQLTTVCNNIGDDDAGIQSKQEEEQERNNASRNEV